MEWPSTPMIRAKKVKTIMMITRAKVRAWSQVNRSPAQPAVSSFFGSPAEDPAESGRRMGSLGSDMGKTSY